MSTVYSLHTWYHYIAALTVVMRVFQHVNITVSVNNQIQLSYPVRYSLSCPRTTKAVSTVAFTSCVRLPTGRTWKQCSTMHSFSHTTSVRSSNEPGKTTRTIVHVLSLIMLPKLHLRSVQSPGLEDLALPPWWLSERRITALDGWSSQRHQSLWGKYKR